MDPWFPYARGSLSTVNGCGVLSTTRRAASRPRSCKSDAISSEFSESNARLSTDPKIKPAVSAASDCVRHANLFRRRDDDEDGSNDDDERLERSSVDVSEPLPSLRLDLAAGWPSSSSEESSPVISPHPRALRFTIQSSSAASSSASTSGSALTRRTSISYIPSPPSA